MRILVASRKKWAGVLAGCTAFVVLGLRNALSGERGVVGWIAVAFFGVGMLVAIVQLMVPSRLAISASTIKVSHMGRHWSRDLARCGAFEVWRNPFARQSLVVFDHPDDEGRRGSKMGRRLSGHSSSLPDTFGMSATQLAELLNEARSKASPGAGSVAP